MWQVLACVGLISFFVVAGSLVWMLSRLFSSQCVLAAILSPGPTSEACAPSTQPEPSSSLALDRSQAAEVLASGQQPSVQVSSRSCAAHTGCRILLSEAPGAPSSDDLPTRRLPSMWKPCLFHGSLPREHRSYLDPCLSL